jgi:hypothetical protein
VTPRPGKKSAYDYDLFKPRAATKAPAKKKGKGANNGHH